MTTSKKCVTVKKPQQLIITWKQYLDSQSNSELQYFLSSKSQQPVGMTKKAWFEFLNKCKNELNKRKV